MCDALGSVPKEEEDSPWLLEPVGTTLGPMNKGLGSIGEALEPVEESLCPLGKAVGIVKEPCRQLEKLWSPWKKA